MAVAVSLFSMLSVLVYCVLAFDEALVPDWLKPEIRLELSVSYDESLIIILALSLSTSSHNVDSHCLGCLNG